VSTHKQPALADVLSQTARALTRPRSLNDTLDAITQSAVDTVPGADYAGILIIGPKGKIESVARTDQLVVDADRAQQETAEGPCLSAIRKQSTFTIDDMQQEKRWPRFRARALDLGVRSMLSYQLFVSDESLGALNLFSREAHAFDDDSQHVGLLFASHAAIALKGAQREKQLNQTLVTRDLIGQAKGILMERHKLSPDDAFALLVQSSQNANVKITEVAQFVSASVEPEPASAD
jgi:GAF domain-containing protein